ncbi:helix-turn-helix transcriptional regulator [Methanolobus bombayensis]|uniref:helix-turn-helix transcriptional regulator n=1 Tax=Methanolobus bombayensis TaxID=38023 RepID=UPI001AE822E7|nr:winged helix-turn-helix domain-containing protein [Methanolobus bombayensis]MBP1908068.1 putative transcriptional regulator [Methanolobus bombayensis]
MRQALIETISRSEKRKDVLLLLQDGPLSMSTILQTLDVSRNALLPQMKILEEGHLVEKDKHNDGYMLTKFGKLIVSDLTPLLGTLEVLEDKMEYWINHYTDCIPPQLFSRLRELKECKLIEPELSESMELSKEAIDFAFKSKKVCALASLYHSDYFEIYNHYAQNNIEFHFIMTQDVLDKFIAEDKQMFDKLLKTPHLNFYIYPEDPGLSTISFVEDCLLLKLLREDKLYDPRYLLSYNKEAIAWGEKLFQYYLKQSELLQRT